jgi:hypothetical protein
MPTNQILHGVILQSLHESMRSGALTNTQGAVAIFHEEPLHNSVDWIEYDKQLDQFTLVYEGGITQDLGMTIDTDTQRNIMEAMTVLLVHMKNKETLSEQKVSIVNKDYS